MLLHPPYAPCRLSRLRFGANHSKITHIFQSMLTRLQEAAVGGDATHQKVGEQQVPPDGSNFPAALMSCSICAARDYPVELSVRLSRAASPHKPRAVRMLSTVTIGTYCKLHEPPRCS